ncbi:PRC-barrel domain-containing protein [Mangrovihabitans endophyticus]|uniref:PRC-barrel domain-containing protein n=1 Tax=Mangrovihabitans endophyticus TaxID=1751298 RepID=A0A8J3FQ08_9ACTN|nr:PRC-barrel domain-containing protein [Mangrovihabitans endophyticus]GGL05934.1 hypothetical protein GCM10012284_45260 [Mangrovihabitans endophyticus]
MSDAITTLVKMSDSSKTIADSDNDIRNRTVVDRDGSEVGFIEDLLIDSQDEKIRFLRVEHGGILGFGATPSFIPIEAITSVDEEKVHIDQSKGQVAEAPRYDPELVDESEYYNDVYGYYGYPPFWAPGYVYPARPFLF